MDFYGTIGPACADVKLLQQMVEAGMTGIRMNLSHGPLAAHKDWLVMLHKAGVKKLLIDLQGPELRIGRLPQPLSLTAGQTVRLGAQGIPCPAALVQGVQPGQELLLDDGKLLARVDTAEPEALVCTVVRGGVLQSRKSLAAPGADIQMPTLTTEDKENLAIAAGCGVTGVMLPFVRGAADIRNLRQALAEAGAPQLKILAKIENLAGVQALPEFLPLVDEVVIARGDLGNAMPLDMVDTGFYVPESKRNRLVTAYKRTENGLVPWTSTHLAVGVYDREPAFESGGAGLVSTLEDYSHFADMLLAGGTYEGRRILSPATVACMTQPQLKDAVRRDMWDSLDGYSYGHLMRICAEPGRIAGLACAGEYGWDGWLGTYFANFPGQQMTILSMQNTVDSGTTRVVRQMRNAVLAALSREN